jgi:hypothetical protein
MQTLFGPRNEAFLMGGRPIPIRLGQFSWGTPTGMSTPITYPQPGTQTGLQTGTQSGLLMHSTSWDGPTDLVVTVLEPTELRPLPGAKVSVNMLSHNTGAVVTPNVASGITDSAGRYRVTLQAPNPNVAYDYEVIIRPGEGQSFPDVKLKGPARTAIAGAAGLSAPETMDATAVVCPSGTDQLVCAIAQYQVLAKQGPPRPSSVTYQPTAPVIDAPQLKAHWDFYSSWWGNGQIKPKEWPELVKNFEQMWGVWSKVPWPRLQLKDLFERCMKRMDLYETYDIWTQEFFVNRYSNFWPKTDEELRRIIAHKALTGLPDIYACMQERIQSKIRSEEKTMKKWQIIGMAASMLFTGNIVASVIFNAASQLSTFRNALDFSKFMMGYQEFVEQCQGAEAEDFTCAYLAPFVIWAQEVLFMGQFFDYVAADAGLPGAEAGLTQEQVIEPMVEHLEQQGVEVPPAVSTPGGVAPPPNILPVIGGVGFVGLLALVGSMVLK